MQDPNTGSATCNGRSIYADCDPVDVDSLNSLHMEVGAAIKKLLGEDPLPFECANPASYDQLCRAILKAIDDAGCEAATASATQLTTICENLETHFVVTWLANGTPVRIPLSKFGEMDPGGGNDCPPDPDTVVRPIGTTFVNAWGDFDVGGTCTGVPQITPASQGWGGTWSITSSVPGNSGLDECGSNSTDTWTKSAC